MRVQGLARGCRDVIDAREIRLRQRWAGSRQRSSIAIDADAECVSGCNWVATGAVHICQTALYGLDETGAEQGHQHEVHTIQAAVDATVAAADDALAMPEHLAEEAVIEGWVPRSG